MKIGLLFAGQGAQYPGMGKSLYESSQAAAKVFDAAGNQIKEWCFNGTKEVLAQTQVTQPCVYTVSMAAYRAFLESVLKHGEDLGGSIEIVGIAGFSLGEYSALTVAGAIDGIGKGLDIVARRGELMQKAGSDDDGNPKGGMVAAIGKRPDILKCVDGARGDGILEGVNFNSPSQTVVAGDKNAIGRFVKAAAEVRIKTIPLSVGTAFHSPMMEPAVGPLKQILLEADLKEPDIKFFCNVTGGDMFDGRPADSSGVAEHVAETMAKQAKSPIYWQETIENMARDGIEALVEFGPGTTLSGLVKKISPQLTALNVEDAESLAKAVQALADMAGAERGA